MSFRKNRKICPGSVIRTRPTRGERMRWSLSDWHSLLEILEIKKMFFLHLSSSLYGAVLWASPMFITELDVILHPNTVHHSTRKMIGRTSVKASHWPGWDLSSDPELSFNESFKASIITLKITTLGYRVMPPFCWNLFIIWFLSTLLSCEGWALPLAPGTSGVLGLWPDWWVLSGGGFSSPAITCNEEVIFWAQYLHPTLHNQLTETSVTQTLQFSLNQSGHSPPGPGPIRGQRSLRVTKRCLHLLG